MTTTAPPTTTTRVPDECPYDDDLPIDSVDCVPATVTPAPVVIERTPATPVVVQPAFTG